MTEYKVKSTDTRKFSLTQNDIILGDLTYEKWFSFTSEIILADNSRYQIEPKGFWGTTIEVRDEKNILLNFKMNWNSNIIINTKFENVENHFVFKPKGIFKSTYALFDTEGQEILVIQPDFKWSKFNYDYCIITSDTFNKFANNELLLLATIHCANYYMTMMSTIIAAG